MPPDPRTELLAAVASDDPDVAEAALWIASEDCPGVEVAAAGEVLDELAEEVKTRAGSSSGVMLVPVIASVLRDRLHLRGAGGGDPRSHYLHHVLKRGAGVPIACSAIWMSVGRRAGIEVEGVGLPGHFVVRIGGSLVDPFADGDLLDDDGVRRIVGKALGNQPELLDPMWLACTPVRVIAARMSRNLRGCYAAREDWDLALRAADRCVDLLPDEPAERRDRGLLRWRLGQSSGACADLMAYLDVAGDAPDRSQVEEVVGRLRASLN